MADFKRILSVFVAIIALTGVCFLTACAPKKEEDENKNAERNETYSFAISATELNLEAGESERLECRYGDRKIVFSTSDEKIATVSDNGTVTAVSAGTAYITAKAEGVPDAEKMCKVTVVKNDYSVKIGGDSVITVVLAGSRVTLDFAAVVYKNGEATSLGVKFSVSPAGAETEIKENSARVTFSSVGKFVVKAEYANVSSSVTVNVVDSIAR